MPPKKRRRARTCCHCRQPFHPDFRNRDKQRYCSAPECRKASKRAAHQRWLNKPQNRTYHRDYHRLKSELTDSPEQKSLKDHCPTKPPDYQPLKACLSDLEFKDRCSPELLLILGLIAQLNAESTPALSQDHMAHVCRLYYRLGCEKFDLLSNRSPENHEKENHHQRGSPSRNSEAF